MILLMKIILKLFVYLNYGDFMKKKTVNLIIEIAKLLLAALSGYVGGNAI